jgi:hypothetical protein
MNIFHCKGQIRFPLTHWNVMVGSDGLGRIVHLDMYQMLANHAIAFKVDAVTHQKARILKSKQRTGIHTMKTGNQGMHIPFN